MLTILVATLSGMSKAETERIFLPFTIWVVALPALLPDPLAPRPPSLTGRTGPRRPAAPADEVVSMDDRNGPTSSSSRTSSPYAMSLRRYLEQEDYEVTVADDGAAGLAAARELRPDLIVLDVMLPGT